MAAQQFVDNININPHNWAFLSPFFASLIRDWKLFQADKILSSWLSWIYF